MILNEKTGDLMSKITERNFIETNFYVNLT